MTTNQKILAYFSFFFLIEDFVFQKRNLAIMKDVKEKKKIFREKYLPDLVRDLFLNS